MKIDVANPGNGWPMRIGRIASSALGFGALILVATAGALWIAALFGIRPFATWLQAAGGALMLIFSGSALLLVASSVLYGLYYVLRHVRDWPHAAHATNTFLKRYVAEIVYGVLMVIAIALLFSAGSTYYGCHFADRCWSMPMMARSDNRAVELAGLGIAVWVVAWLRGVRR